MPKLWPTPNSRDHKGAPGAGCVERGGHQSSLPMAVKMDMKAEKPPQTSQLTLFAADTPASPLVRPGSEKARMMTVTSGQKCIGSWLPSGPVGSLLKMLLGTSAWASTACFLTWKTRATPAGRLLFQLAPSTPRTEETEFGLWPTPMTPNGGRSIPPGSEIKGGMSPTAYRDGNKYQVDLNQAVKKGLWATPRSFTAMAAEITEKTSQRTRGNLEEQVGQTMWPTPTVNDSKNNGAPSQHERRTKALNVVAGGSLNPAWVEWLMGFPEGWTDLKD